MSELNVMRRVSLAAAFGLSVSLLALTASSNGAMAQTQEVAKTKSGRVAEADPEAPAKGTKKKPLSPVAAVNLINALVAKGSLTEEQGAELIKQAEDEAYVSREAAKTASEKADLAETTAVKAASSVPEKGARRVAYVPDIVKEQIVKDVQGSVFVKAEKEGWAAPNALPEWTKYIRISGDIRTRYEGVTFPKGNGPIIDFNTINNNASGFDATAGIPSPLLDSNQNRDRFRLRARLGVEANLLNGFYAGARLGTGETNSPVSLNQTLGANGGDFSKYSVWLDRAFIGYTYGAPQTAGLKDEPARSSDASLSAFVGRFENPFFATDLIWDTNLNFDGIAAKSEARIFNTGTTAFVNGGAFPIFNSSFNLPTNDNQKTPSADRYLFGGQAGVRADVQDTTKLTLAGSYFDFYNVQGKLSSPCDVSRATITGLGCDTDIFRPLFAQKGNTYLRLRNLTTTTGALSDPQFYGLASKFDVVTGNARLDIGYFSPFNIVLEGEFVKNLGFDRKSLEKTAQNNFNGAVSVNNVVVKAATFAGGDTGYLIRATVGNTKLEKFGDWNVSAAYRYLESDATVDAFTNSDFGLGGTNLQGFIVGGQLGLGRNVYTEVKYLSADQIAGTPFSVDIVQVDLNAKF